MLREEIMQHIRETYRTEFSAAIAVGTTYTWLLLHRQDSVPRIVWLVPPFVILVAACRWIMLTIQIRVVAGYLRRIEEVAFGEDEKLPGWERYISAGRQHSFIVTGGIIGGIVWVFVFLASSFASWILSR